MPNDYNLLLELAKLVFANVGADAPGAPSVKGHPKLHVIVGEAIPALSIRMRSMIPPSKYLLHVHPPGPGVEALRASRPKGERTLFLEITPDDAMLVQLSTFLKTLRPDHASMTVQNSKDASVMSAIPRVQQALSLEMPNLKVDRMSALTRLRCSLLNLGLICSGPLLSAKVQGDIPALVCGAGPSLAGQFGFIAKNASRYAIVACGHAAIKMKEAGIEPDFIVEADPRCRINWSQFKGGFSKPLVALACADPAVTARFERRIWFEGDSPEAGAAFDLLGLNIPRISISRGVIVTALDFAFKLGCKQAALVGCDLALSDDGATHAGARRADGDELSLLEVEGSLPGSKVKTTLDFNEIRKALEAHIEQANRKDVLVNCTPSGARIAGIAQQSLEDFTASLGSPSPAKRIEFSEKPHPPNLFESVKKISGLFADYSEASEKLSDASRRLARELKSSTFDQARFQKEKDSFDAAIRNEGAFASAPGFGRIVMLPKNKAEDICDEEPGSNLQSKDAPGQLRLYAKRAVLAADFCSELKADLDFISSSLSGMYPAEQRDPMDFKPFRNLALASLHKLNPALAKAMEQKLLPSAEAEGFSLHLRFEDIPHAALRLPDGGTAQFNGLLSGSDEAHQLVAAFAKAFDPKRQAAVIVAPGNYAIVEEFAKALPDVPCLIVEPWPSLLAETLRRCCFLHRLPEGSSIVIANNAFSKKWPKELAKASHLFKSRSLTPARLLNPKTAALPDVKALLEGGDIP